VTPKSSNHPGGKKCGTMVNLSSRLATVASRRGAHIAQIGWQISTDGTGFVDSPPKTLKATLQAIRDLATNALNRIAEPQIISKFAASTKKSPISETCLRHFRCIK
jgi:hypothetical protein